MGSFFGAELCDLIGLYILDMLRKIYEPNQIGLYRDDGLAVIKYKNKQELENTKKQTIKIMKEIGFNITLDIGMTKCNFLDITLDLANNCYMPYRKDNSSIKYINNKSNHPMILKKNLPKMIENRLNRLSTNPKIFNDAKTDYQTALRKSNFKHKLEYTEKTNITDKKRRKRTRKILFFNPPYCQSVKTNVGKKFLNLIDKHFRSENMKKNFNRNNCKVSYCCMENVKSLISRHNKRVISRMNNKKDQNKNMCNCRNKNSCPLSNMCLQENVVYKATISSQNEIKEYIGSTGGQFKKRWYTHMSDIKNVSNKGTELSKYIWKLKNNSIHYELKWSIMHKIGELKNISNICKTCNLEKIEIALAEKNRNLNKRQELFYTCPHFRKLYFNT